MLLERLGENQDVINLYKNEVINEILWHIVNEGLNNLPSIGKHEYLVNLQGIKSGSVGGMINSTKYHK